MMVFVWIWSCIPMWCNGPFCKTMSSASQTARMQELLINTFRAIPFEILRGGWNGKKKIKNMWGDPQKNNKIWPGGQRKNKNMTGGSAKFSIPPPHQDLKWNSPYSLILTYKSEKCLHGLNVMRVPYNVDRWYWFLLHEWVHKIKIKTSFLD